MEKEDNELFDFITQKEHFTVLTKAVEQMAIVKSELLRRFWNEVMAKLDILKEDDLASWKVYIDPNIEGKGSQFSFYDSAWEDQDGDVPFCIVCESLSHASFYGFWINQDMRTLYQTDRIKTHMKSKRPGKEFKTDNNPWWAFWDYMNFNFGTYRDIAEILPETLEQRAAEYAQEIYKLAILLKPEYEALFTFKQEANTNN